MISGTRVTSPVVNQADGEEKIKYETKEDHATLSRDDFMKLFVTQLQYQDPMNPMESAEMASQVAQFNMVDLMYKNNTSLEHMANALNSSASVSAINLIGHEVEYQGKELYMGPEGPRPFYLEIPDDGISTCKVTIRDSSGHKVGQVDMDSAEAGTKVRLDWDGTDGDGNLLPPGTYHVSIEATGPDDNEIDIPTRTVGTVSGIDNTQDGLPEILIKDGPVLQFDEIKSIQG